MRSTVLDIGATPATNLKPGETGIRLKTDPYYGKVDVGADTGDSDDAKARDFERKERDKISQLPVEDRAKAEEKLGRDLAKRRTSAKGKDGRGAKDISAKDIPTDATRDDLQVALGYFEETIESGAHALTGEEQSRIEVLTGKRLQQRAPQEGPREPIDVIDNELPDGGEGEAARMAAVNTPMEPAERDRDKTKAAKPGESVRESAKPARDDDKTDSKNDSKGRG